MKTEEAILRLVVQLLPPVSGIKVSAFIESQSKELSEVKGELFNEKLNSESLQRYWDREEKAHSQLKLRIKEYSEARIKYYDSKQDSKYHNTCAELEQVLKLLTKD